MPELSRPRGFVSSNSVGLLLSLACPPTGRASNCFLHAREPYRGPSVRFMIQSSFRMETHITFFSTWRASPSMSKDLILEVCGDVFAHLPEWRKGCARPQSLWAPDVSYFNGKYHLSIRHPLSAATFQYSVWLRIKLSISRVQYRGGPGESHHSSLRMTGMLSTLTCTRRKESTLVSFGSSGEAIKLRSWITPPASFPRPTKLILPRQPARRQSCRRN